MAISLTVPYTPQWRTSWFLVPKCALHTTMPYKQLLGSSMYLTHNNGGSAGSWSHTVRYTPQWRTSWFLVAQCTLHTTMAYQLVLGSSMYLTHHNGVPGGFSSTMYHTHHNVVSAGCWFLASHVVNSTIGSSNISF
jgi:hypothetical protein